METIVHWVSEYGYAGLCVALALGIVGLPIPDETLLTFAGYLCYRQDLKLPFTLLWGFVGSVCGITASYGLGRSFGSYLVHRYGYLLSINDEKIKRIEQWFERIGKWTLTGGYFIPGIRHLTAYVAGTTALPFSLFALYAYLGGFIWSATFILLGYFLGDQWENAPDSVQRNLIIVLGIIIAIAAIYFFVVRRRKK